MHKNNFSGLIFSSSYNSSPPRTSAAPSCLQQSVRLQAQREGTGAP